MIILHQFAPAFGLANASPFCMKVESYLRLAGLEYEVRRFDNPARAPKGKLPMITDKGRDIPDSAFILAYLRKTYDVRLDENLGARQKAAHHALRLMLEEHLYFSLLHSRWIDPANAPLTRDAFFGFLPGPLTPLVFALARWGVRKALHAQGMGRHSPDEIYALGVEDITALRDLLGDDDYYGGAQPGEIDATAYAFIANLVHSPFDDPLGAAARSHANLLAYTGRMDERLFPELQKGPQ